MPFGIFLKECFYNHWRKCLLAKVKLCLAISLPAMADTPHLIASKQSESLILHYRLIDLGKVDLEQEVLTRQQDGLSLGPSINNNSDIIGNRSSGGFITLRNESEYMPRIQDSRLNFYSINNQRDILLSISRQSGVVEWFVWPTEQGWDSKRLWIDPVELTGEKIFLSKINDQKQVIGIAKIDTRSMPLEWSPDRGLYRIGFSSNANLFGVVKDINQNGTIVGKSHRQLEAFPFIQKDDQELSLFKMRRYFKPPSDGKIIFEDVLISNDDIIYGTYWINQLEDLPQNAKVKELQAFKWQPVENVITLINLDGMRISDMNRNGRIVGSHRGKASFREGDSQPIDLTSSMTPEESLGWELLEVTAINDRGELVGYGKKEGVMHLFLAQPL